MESQERSSGIDGTQGVLHQLASLVPTFDPAVDNVEIWSNKVNLLWVPSGAQIADSLTKVMDNTILRTCLHKGFYSLHDEQEILKARSDSRSRLQWLQSQAPLSESSAVTHGKAKSSMSQSQFAKIN